MEEIEEIIERATWDGDELGRLYDELMPKGGATAPEAVTVVPLIFRAIRRADDAGSLVLFLLELAAHEGGEVILPALRNQLARLEELSTSDDYFVSSVAVDLLGRLGPDDDLAARLRQRATGNDPAVCHLLLAVARLQGAEAMPWLKDFLAPQHSGAVRVSAIVALRLAGSPPLPGMDDIVVSAWEADPDVDVHLPSDNGARLRDLVAYLGPQVILRLGRSASAEIRKDVAQTLGRVTLPDDTLLLSLLKDRDERVQQCAWRTLCCTEELARRNVDVLAKAISDGHRVRFGAANALAKLGDPRASLVAAEAIGKGKAGKEFLRELGAQDAALDDELRQAALNRIDELARLINKAGHGMKPLREFGLLMSLIDERGGPECVPQLAETLRHAEWFGAVRLRRSLIFLGKGDARAIAALEATSDGSLRHLAENWIAGGDEEALRRKLAATPPDDPLATRLREHFAAETSAGT